MELFRRIFGKPGEEPSSTGIEHQEVVDESPEAVDVEDITSDDFAEAETRPAGIQNDITSPESLVPGVTQPLNPEVVDFLESEGFVFGQSTDVGLVRTNNQDAALSLFFNNESVDNRPPLGLFVVADGMGGHHDGEKASAIASRMIASIATRSIYLPMMNGSKKRDEILINDLLVDAVKQANDAVITNIPEGGTTVTAVAVIGSFAHIAHVGDSRAYLITKESIEQITRDHSLVQRLIELDQLTPDEAERHPQKNVLYRALGQSEALEVDTLTRRLPPESRLLICSDGLWGLVEEREIYEISMNTHDPQHATDKLVALANTRGGLDNITAIILRVI